MRYYNGTAGQFVAWAKISSLANGSAYYLGFGNSSITTDGSTSAVWNTTWANGYYPMGDGTTLDVNNYSSSGLNGTNHGVTAAAGTGNLGGSGDFERSNNDYVEIANDSSNTMGSSSFAIAAWVKRKSTGIFGGIQEKMASNDSEGWTLHFDSGNHVGFTTVGQSTTYDVNSTGTYSSTSVWYLIVAVRSAGLRIYVNGSADGSGGGPDLIINNTDPLAFGPYRHSYAANMNDAYMSDLRLGKTFAPTANFITTMYNSESAPGTFASYAFDTPSTGAFSRIIICG